ncbi:unnamed protein product [Closterium sp. NIES-53]
MPRPCPGPALLMPVVAHQGPMHRPPPPFPVTLRGDPGGGGAAQGAAAPGAAAPGPRAAAPGPWCSHPWPLEQPPLVQPPLNLSSRPWPLEQPPLDPATPPLDPVPPPPCAAHCRPLLPVAALPPPFFVSLLRVQPWNGGSGGGGAGSLVGTFDVWIDDLQLFLQCDRADGLSLFDLTSGVSPAPPATADSSVRSQWATRDAAARLAVRRHLPTTERAHFSQYKSAQTLYDAVVARYSSPATAALSRLFLPYLFPDLTTFLTIADLITHLCTSDTRYRAALPTEFCAQNPPPYVPHSLLRSHPTP